MLPKIAVGVFKNNEDFLSLMDIDVSKALIFESEGAKVDDFRSWIYSGINILRSRPEYTMVIWKVDSLSPECQSVLLKPMEELDDRMKLFLVAENENRILPTILSRADLEYFQKPQESGEKYWNEIRKCWSSGPAACISFVDGMDKDKAAEALEEIIRKLKSGLSEEVNNKRLVILDKAIDCLYLLKQTNVNQKLLLDNFLIASWRVIKS